MLRNFLSLIAVFLCVILLINYGPTALDYFQNEPIKHENPSQEIDTEKKESSEAIADNASVVVEPKNIDAVEIVESEDKHEYAADEIFESEIVTTEIPPLETKEFILSDTFEKGETLGKILGQYTDANEIDSYIKAIEKVFSVRSFKEGNPYIIEYNTETEKIIRFEYEVDNFKKLIVENSPPVAKIEEIAYDKKLTFVENTIEDNLFNSVTNLGETPALAIRIANLFAWEVNFVRDIQTGDSFSILVEKLYRDGEFKAYGRALGATFNNKNKVYEAFLFYDAKRKEGYYNKKGENLKKVLLQSPLSFTRVTSGYSRSRKHPIFGDRRPHLGIDYGAPTGTPIMAVGAGTVTVRGWVKGFGNHIKIRHSSGFESMYSHMSRYGKGIKKGSSVRQGQVIGYVGSTGYSTGPHLDFRLKLNGKYINPSTAMSPRAESVSKKDKADFEKRIDIIREYMQKKRDINEYDPISMNPPQGK